MFALVAAAAVVASLGPSHAVNAVALGQKVEVIKGGGNKKAKAKPSKSQELEPQVITDVSQAKAKDASPAVDAKASEKEKEQDAEAQEKAKAADAHKAQQRKQIEKMGADVRESFGNAADALAE